MAPPLFVGKDGSKLMLFSALCIAKKLAFVRRLVGRCVGNAFAEIRLFVVSELGRSEEEGATRRKEQ